MKRINTNLFKCMLLAMLFVGYANVSIAQIFWSEDFTDGIPADWTNVDLSDNAAVWTWCDDPMGGAGGGTTGGCNPLFDDGINMQEPFAGPTAGTGYVTLDSDGITASLANPHISELTTPPINCSTQTEVYIAFNAHIGVYDLSAQDNALLQVSIDGGTTWVDYTLFPGVTTNAAGGERWSDNPEEVVVDLTAQCAGQAQVLLRWHWTAGWEYFWNIDDVILTSINPIDPNDMRVNDNFFAGAPSAMIPASQVEPFGFVADIENIGLEDQTGVSLNVTIVNDADPTTNVYDESLAYGTVEADSLVENVLFPDAGFLPPATLASYTGTYTVSAELADMDPSDNTRTFNFEVTEDLWAKDAGLENATTFAPAASNWEGDLEPFSWAWGNHFHVVNDGYFATEAHFSLGNPEDIVGQQVIIKFYSWNDATPDGNGDFNADPNERTWLGFAIYDITDADSSGAMITVPIVDLANEPGVLMNANTDYILMLEYAATEETPTQFMATQAVDYGAAIFRSQELGAHRNAGMLGISDPLSDEAFGWVGFGTDIVPVVRLTIADEKPVLDGTAELLDDNNKVNVYPSPATDFISVDVDLAKIQEEVIVEVVNVRGTVIARQNHNDFQQGQLRFDLSNIATGSYFLSVITPDGQKVTKFSVVK